MITERDLDRVNDAALRLLGDIGCAVLDPDALMLLEPHETVVEGERVRLGEELAAAALATVPAGYALAGRRAEFDVRVALEASSVLSGARGQAHVLHNGAPPRAAPSIVNADDLGLPRLAGRSPTKEDHQ